MTLHASVADELAGRSISHEVLECDPDLADTAEFCAAYDIPIENSANAILIASRKPEGEYALCVVLATDRLDVNGTVRKKLGVRKASFATAEDTLERTGQAIGGVTVFGIPDEVPIWVDRAVTETGWVIVGAGTRTAKLKIDPELFVVDDRYEVVDGLTKEQE